MLLQEPSPDALPKATEDQIAAIRIGGRPIGIEYVGKLHALAAQAPRLVLLKVTRMMLETTARRVLELTATLVRMDDATEAMVDRLYPSQVLMRMPGLSKVSVAAILVSCNLTLSISGRPRSGPSAACCC